MPVAGDVADYLFQANKMSASFCRKHGKVKQALEMGIPAEKVAQISEDGKNLPASEKRPSNLLEN